MKDGTLTVLMHMLDHPAMVRPWQAGSLARELAMPETTVYRHLRKLREYGLVDKVPAGYILGDKVLSAGIKFQKQLARLVEPEQFNKLKEALYG